MSEQLVTGIFPSSDVAELEKALGDAPGIDHSRLAVVTRDRSTETHDESFLNFVHVAEHLENDTIADGMTRGTGMMTDSGGTGVPGVSIRDYGTQTLATFVHHAANYLGAYHIPGDQIENYNDAVEEGRTVVVYKATDDAEPASQALKTAGLKNVKIFVTK